MILLNKKVISVVKFRSAHYDTFFCTFPDLDFTFNCGSRVSRRAYIPEKNCKMFEASKENYEHAYCAQ